MVNDTIALGKVGFISLKITGLNFPFCSCKMKIILYNFPCARCVRAERFFFSLFFSFTKTGLGELVLSGQNTYTSATTVAAGTLTLANAGSLSSNVTVNAGAVFKLHADTQGMSFGRSISGDGNLLKTGGNKATLTGANTYTGTTSIIGGTLELAGAVSMAANGGAIEVASGATLLLNTTQELT